MTRAWRCWCPRLGDDPDDDELCGIYRAATRSKAKYLAYLHALDASFDGVTLMDLRARRAPEFDDVPPFRNGIMPRYLITETCAHGA